MTHKNKIALFIPFFFTKVEVGNLYLLQKKINNLVSKIFYPILEIQKWLSLLTNIYAPEASYLFIIFVKTATKFVVN